MRAILSEEHPSCPSCSWMFFEDPKVAAAALVTLNGKVLLVKRIFEPHIDKWSLPAGFVNAHEHPERAAERECLEETGLEVHVTGLHDIISGREHANGADIVLVYNASIVGGKMQAGDDASDAGFFPRDNLPPLAFRATCTALGIE